MSGAFAALEAGLRERPGFRLLTVLVLDDARGVGRRVHTSDPDAYPLGGEKPLRRDGEYFEAVVRAGVPRLLRARGDHVREFPDHALVLSLGCECAVNVPIRRDGRTLGALNLLDRAGAYSERDFPALVAAASRAADALPGLVAR